MQHIELLVVVSIAALFAITCTKDPAGLGNNPDTVTDADGNVYATVKIGNQVWMAENLRVTRYNDGSAIPNITSVETWTACSSSHAPAYSTYGNTTNLDNIKKYGALYNWYTVNTGKLAPAGWHVPTDSEWTILEKYLVLNGYNWDGTTDTSQQNKIAKSLAAKTDWNTDSIRGTIGCDLTMNNSSSFSALPGGYRSDNGKFNDQCDDGFWWSATESEYDASNAWDRYLYSYYGNLVRNYNGKSCGFSVRLVKD